MLYRGYIPTEIGFHTNWILNHGADKHEANNFGTVHNFLALLKSGRDVFILALKVN